MALQAQFERQWLVNPGKFAPKTATEQLRIKRTFGLIEHLLTGSNIRAVDLGMGWGTLTQKMSDTGTKVDGIDIAGGALNHFKQREPNSTVNLLRDALPQTSLADDSYDIVACCDVIAHLPEQQHRLLMSELQRLVKQDGHVVISTPLELGSFDALEKFAALIDTEFELVDSVLSYHRYALALHRFLKIPARYARAYRNHSYYKRQLKRRRGIGRAWFALNSSRPLAYLWSAARVIFGPTRRFLKTNITTATRLEKLCRTLTPGSGVTHVIFVARPKQLQEIPAPDLSLVSARQQYLKRRVWE